MALQLDHFKVFFAGATVWADPRERNIVPQGARRNARIRLARFFVIDVSANYAHVFSVCHKR